MLDYNAEYKRAFDAYHQEKAVLEKQIYTKEAKIERLKRQIDKLTARKSKLQCPYWKDIIVKPLADALVAYTGKSAQVHGPFGLRAETNIYLTDNPGDDIMNCAYDYITLVPDTTGDSVVMHYDTGLVIRDCVPGSIAEINRFGNETLPLPDTIKEIAALLKHYEGREKGGCLDGTDGQ